MPEGAGAFLLPPSPCSSAGRAAAWYSSVQNRNHDTQGGVMGMLIAIIGSCVVFAACLIALWLMP